MKDKYTIGEVAKKTGISAPTLRYYDELDLVKPGYTDETTGYRYYSYGEFWQIEIVKICTNMGIPLKELKKVLNSNDHQQFVQLMYRQRDIARKKLEIMQTMTADLEWMAERYDKIESCQMGTYEIKRLPERTVLFVAADPDEDSDNLHFKLQREADEKLDRRSTIQREYGYELHKSAFLQGTAAWSGEFLIVHEGEYEQSEKTRILPEGDYLCFMCRPFGQQEILQDILGRIKEQYEEPQWGIITAMEAALYFYDWREEVYEIQIQLIKK